MSYSCVVLWYYTSHDWYPEYLMQIHALDLLDMTIKGKMHNLVNDVHLTPNQSELSREHDECLVCLLIVMNV